MIVFSSLHSENPSLTTTELGEKLQVNRKTIQRRLNGLKERNIIERTGSNKRGSWIVH